MVYREFVVPDADSILDAIGVSPKSGEGDDASQVLRISSGDRSVVILSYDTSGRSVRVQWIQESELIVDIFRESATNFTVIAEQGRSTIRVDLESDSLVGFLEIQVYPDIRITDQLLFC
jgi:hypothetical protein